MKVEHAAAEAMLDLSVSTPPEELRKVVNKMTVKTYIRLS